MTEFEAKVGRSVLTIVGLLIVFVIGAAVVWSIVADAEMLVDAGGRWMLLAFLVVPTLIGLSWLVPRVGEFLEDRHSEREGEKVLRELDTRREPERLDPTAGPKGPLP